MAGDAPAAVLVVLALLSGLACGGSSQADRVCTIAQAVATDSAIAPERRGVEWAERAHAAVDDPRLRSVLEPVARAELVGREAIEAAFTDVTGKPWACPALDELYDPN